MKIATLTYLLAGASIASYAGASPLRVVVLPNQAVEANMRFGHAVANTNPDIARIAIPFLPTPPTPPTFVPVPSVPHEAGSHGSHHPCHGGNSRKLKMKLKKKIMKMKMKMLDISNLFRQALGLSTTETTKIFFDLGSADLNRGPKVPGNHYRLAGFNVEDHPHHPHPNHPDHPHHGKKHHGKHHHGKHHHHKEFMKRIHTALMALGPWEGRAVAFVLGCGIGVLLRMLWVVAIVSYRMIRGEREENQYIEVICDYTDAENILVPPPQYICENEKVNHEVSDSKKQVDEA